MPELEESLPSSWYLDDAIYALEKEAIFCKEWLCVAREEQVPDKADSMVLDVMGESVILVRNNARELRAFYNVCRHRGSRLCRPARETSKADDEMILRGGVRRNGTINCPYHAWSYDLDGWLIKAPHMTREMGFSKEEIRLHQVALRTWGGFVFLCLADEQPSFETHVQRVKDLFGRYPLSALRIGQSIRYEADANWKVLCENYNECYHCGPVHPELCKVVPAYRDKGGANLDWDRGIPHRQGANTFTATGRTSRRAFPGLNQDEQERHKGELLYPNLFLSLARDHVAAFILQPVAAGHTRLDCYFLFEPFEMNQEDFDPSDVVEFWDLINRQDWAICEEVQSGMSSRVHHKGLYSPMEDWNLDIRRYVTDRIGHLVNS
ncbi:MAG: aromatic ring-hydroxylating dioxygenase subunit alpha [bacterium]|nr:aromatic ring-hydroxylating dioxygenase subunit alpha [Gammaproteobacteria bacterium]HIL97895.1 aromatic ring-hydroxylating dioxygenase subunit alpha [Pseudomonadales bacterium]